MKNRFLVLLLIIGCFMSFSACKKEERKVGLAVPTNLAIENQYIMFDEVENASYYSIYYDGNTFTIKPSYNGEIVYDASKIFTEAKTYQVKVKAIGTGKYYDSGYSNTILYTKTDDLPIPEIKINGNTLTWSSIENASKYTIEVTFPNKTKDYFTYTNNTYDIRNVLSEVGNYVFRVKAGVEGDSNSYSAEASYKYTKTLSTPNNLSLKYDSGELYLYFISDDETVSYSFNVNGELYEMEDSLISSYLENNGYNNYKKIRLLSFLKFKNPSFSANVFNVSVKCNASPYSNYYDSNYSNKEVYYITKTLSSPTTSLTVSNGLASLSWTEVPEATNYAIYKNLELYTSVKSAEKLVFNATDIEDAIFNVQAVGTDKIKNSCLSKSVFLSSLTQNLEASASLNGENLVLTGDADVVTVEIYNNNSYTKIETTDSEIKLSNYVDYGVYKVNATIYKSGFKPIRTTIDFDYSKTLNKPTRVNIGNAKSMYKLTFDEVEGAIGYAVEITSFTLSGPKSEIIPKIFTNNSIDLTRYLRTVGEYGIRVKAVADITKNVKDSSWSSSIPVMHVVQLNKPMLTVELVDGEYLLKFPKVGDALNYTILLNYVPIYEGKVSYSSEGYSITSYLTTAQVYTIMVKAHAATDSNKQDSEYAVCEVRKYIQLDVINSDNMRITSNEGKYYLDWKTQTNAASYNIRIYHEDSASEEEFKVSSSPCEITNYVQDSGRYKIYITAIADTEGEFLYQSSAESGNPYVLTKDKPTLDVVNNFNVGSKTWGKNIITASWDAVENADRYYLSINYKNINDANSQIKLIDQVYCTTNSVNLADFLNKEGQYTINIRAVSDGVYEYSAWTTYAYNYTMTIDVDFIRNTIMFNGNIYNHYITSNEQLEALLQYYYLHDNVIYKEGINPYTLKLMLSNSYKNTLQEYINSYNDANNPEVKLTVNDRLLELSKQAISNYKERAYLSKDLEMPKEYISGSVNYYLYNYESKFNDEKVIISGTNNALVKAKYEAIDVARPSNYIFDLELKEKYDVSTTEQLFSVVQSGYAPNFVIGSETAKQVYENCKAILRSICSDDMKDYEKVISIYNWVIKNVNYNYDFEKSQMDKSLGSTVSDTSTILVGDCIYNYLEAIFISEDKLAVSNAIAKAFVLMCGLEGIEAIKVNGKKNATYYYWNKVYLKDIPYGTATSEGWFVVDISSSYETIELKSIDRTVGSYQYLLTTDAYHKNKTGLIEEYAIKAVTAEMEFSYFANTLYDYYKLIRKQGEPTIEVSGKGSLKYDSSKTYEDYIKEVMGLLWTNISVGESIVLEMDMTTTDGLSGIESKITEDYYLYWNNIFGINNLDLAINARLLNNKLLIVLAY